MADIEERIIKVVQAAGTPLSAEEISRRTGISLAEISSTLEVLVRRRKMTRDNHQYVMLSHILKSKQDQERSIIDNTR